MIVNAWNPDTTDLERTNLTTIAAIGATSLAVKNSNRFAYNNILLIGAMGSETAEVVSVGTTGLTTSSVPLSAPTQFAHTADEPVFVLRYDKVLFYSSTTVSGTKTLLDTQTIDVDNATEKTSYDDANGTAGTYYWTKLKNSFTLEETDYSDYVVAAGPARNSIGKVIGTVVSRIKDPGYSVLTVDDYLDLAQEVNDDLISQRARPYDFLMKTILLDRTAGQAYVNYPIDYLKFDWLEYDDTVAGQTLQRRLIPINHKQFIRNYAPDTVSYRNDYISTIALDADNKKILLRPAPATDQAGAFVLHYFADFLPMDNISQQVQTPNSLVYKYKFLAEAYRVKAERDPSFMTLASGYETKYGNEIVKLQRSIIKDVGSAKSFGSGNDTSSRPGYPTRRFTL